MIHSAYQSIAKEKEEKRLSETQRSVPYIIADYLTRHGYTATAATFHSEANLSQDVRISDNTDLEIIVEEYMSYYHMRFNKYPKLCSKSTSNATAGNETQHGRKEKAAGKQTRIAIKKTEDDEVSKQTGNPDVKMKQELELTATPIFPANHSEKTVPNSQDDAAPPRPPQRNLYPQDFEWMEITSLFKKEIVLRNLNVHWEDIKGLEKEKKALKTAFLLPIKHPDLFNNIYTPWKSVLLYGPPGTGKTMLAKAVATESRCTFFNITCSSIISKWRGDSEKYVRVLFELANVYAPSVIFIDEIDWIGTTGNGNSTEAAKRFRSEFLTRFDGLLTPENSQVMLLAATNLPWDIDTALLRRLEKRIYIGLPEADTRREILKSYFTVDVRHVELLTRLVEKTEGFSCADLKVLLKEAWMDWISLHSDQFERNLGTLRHKDFTIQALTEEKIDKMLASVKRTVRDTNKYRTWLENVA